MCARNAFIASACGAERTKLYKMPYPTKSKVCPEVTLEWMRQQGITDDTSCLAKLTLDCQ